MNSGQATLDWLFREQLQIDKEWSEQTPRGFVWWPAQLAQRIEIVGEEEGEGGEIVFLVSIATDMLRGLKLTDTAVLSIHAAMMPFATFAGPVYDEAARTLTLRTLVRVHPDNVDWVKRMLGMAALLQVDEARLFSAHLATILQAEQALSAPAGRELRYDADEMTEMFLGLCAAQGAQAARWSAAEFQDAVTKYMQGPPALMASAGGAALTVEFPFGSQSSLCQVMATQPHPRFGTGLFALQTFPVNAASDVDGARQALELNSDELSVSPFGYGCGSYVYRNELLCFVSFIPNVAYRSGLLPNVYYSCAQRARELSVRFTGVEWSPQSFSLKKSGIGRLFDRIRGWR